MSAALNTSPHPARASGSGSGNNNNSNSNTMLEAHIHHPLRVTLHRIPIPTPRASEVLIKVHVSGSNPKDWKRPVWNAEYNGTNQGDDIAGVVAAVGSAVTQFRPGDRVAALHHLQTPGGSYAEYAIAPEHTTFHIPASTTFEEAATIPLAAMTAALGLFVQLGLPEPWVANAHPDNLPKGGIVIYGAASAVGAFAVQLARRAGIHPIIAVAGNGIPFVQSLLKTDTNISAFANNESGGDVIVDYRKGNDSVVNEIRAAVPKGQKLQYAFDAVSDGAKSSYANICKAFSSQEEQGSDHGAGDGSPRLTMVLPAAHDDPDIPRTVQKSLTMVSSVFGPDKDFGYAWFRLLELGLKDGWFRPHPYQVVPGGLDGIEEGLKDLKDGKASATKYVFRIAETKELSERTG
ncbi:Trans-enoyl reductase fsr4 [Exophiala dermatitidis]|uniref:NADPH2:quinone reductase n=1 Tax=Exophiala dermatitidis (strain ATCC 34100 / CBS 525.76 / NIH/UT8656) TaxID=858893 RepID=H6BN38_EXODN|nr:NADPH2:quinone reductase [Exophiala dermatitidis NIH/UT8656]EHY52163.1 NADPH2:quinone reductase [Exophiala dermatitidis NIH/UT8656]